MRVPLVWAAGLAGLSTFVVLPLHDVAEDPRLVLATARAFAERAGARLAQEWSHGESVHIAVQRSEQSRQSSAVQAELAPITARLRRMEQQDWKDPAQVARLGQQLREADARLEQAARDPS